MPFTIDSASDTVFTNRRLALRLAMLIACVLYLPSLAWSFGHDQYVFAEIGSLMLRGIMPYTGAWDVKPPNIFYLNAFAQWVFGRHEYAVRLMDYASMMSTAYLLFKLTERTRAIGNNPTPRNATPSYAAPFAATVLFSAVALSLGLADTAQTESFSLVWLVGASLLIVKQDRRILDVALAGCCIGVAAVFKTTHALFILPLAIELARGPRDNSIRALLALVTGLLSAAILCYLPLMLTGAWSEYLRIFTNVRTYHSDEHSVAIGSLMLLRVLWVYVDLWLAVVAGWIVLAIARRRNKTFKGSNIVLPLTNLACGFAIVIAQHKGWGYHLVVIIPWLVMLCALGFEQVTEWISTRFRWRYSRTVLLSLALLLLLSPANGRRYRNTRDALRGVMDRGAYRATLGDPSAPYYPPATDSLATYIRQHTELTESVFIFGQEPGAYWMSDRLPASRYIYSLLWPYPVMTQLDFEQMSREITVAKPKLIVKALNDSIADKQALSFDYALNRMSSKARQMLVENYRVTDTVFDRFVIFTRLE